MTVILLEWYCVTRIHIHKRNDDLKLFHTLPLNPLNNFIISMTAFCNRVIDEASANNKLLVTSNSYKSIGSVMQNETNLKYYPYSASFAFTLTSWV